MTEIEKLARENFHLEEKIQDLKKDLKKATELLETFLSFENHADNIIEARKVLDLREETKGFIKKIN